MALVTITRSLGCGEADIAQRVARSLQVKLYDDFELKESALHMGIRSEDLKSLDEKAPGFFDPSLYDLVINTQKMGVDSAVRLITEAAGSDEVKACSLGAVDTMKRRSLEKQIQAALIENDINVSVLHIEVPELDVVQVWGFAHSNEDRDRILQTLNTLSDIKEVRAEITIMPSDGD